jgi:uncharacterized protein (DUF427 family)
VKCERSARLYILRCNLRLEKLAVKLATDGPHKILSTPRLVQLLFNGSYIVRTTEAVFVWEVPYYPQLYFPKSALNSSNAEDFDAKQGEEIKDSNGKVVAHKHILTVGNKSTNQCFVFADKLSSNGELLSGLVKVDFNAIDQWFEESTPIFVHPKDPFKRIDILQSTRPIKISIHETVVAETASSMHLYETGLPCRYYIPLTDVRPGVLKPSKTRTQCPYKGEAEYYSVDLGNGKVVEDVVWFYNRPTLECGKIESMTKAVNFTLVWGGSTDFVLQVSYASTTRRSKSSLTDRSSDSPRHTSPMQGLGITHRLFSLQGITEASQVAACIVTDNCTS